jgi:hypothetical protein
MTFQKRQNCGDSKKDRRLPGADWEGGMRRWKTGFLGQTILNDTI